MKKWRIHIVNAKKLIFKHVLLTLFRYHFKNLTVYKLYKKILYITRIMKTKEKTSTPKLWLLYDTSNTEIFRKTHFKKSLEKHYKNIFLEIKFHAKFTIEKIFSSANHSAICRLKISSLEEGKHIFSKYFFLLIV